MNRSAKIVYDFRTERLLEISYDNVQWHRVTCRTFRSFNGPRRIDYVPYVGRVYYLDTNVVFLGRTKKPRTIQITELNAKRKKQTKKLVKSTIRPNEKFIQINDTNISNTNILCSSGDSMATA